MSIESIEIAVLDSYQKFIETFNISFEKLIEFGLSETILVSPEEAREQWNKLISDFFVDCFLSSGIGFSGNSG